MKLVDALPHIKPGDVFLFEGKGWRDWPVQVGSLSPFVHAGQAMWNAETAYNGFRRLHVVEAMRRGGIRSRPLDNYLVECHRYGRRVHWFGISDAQIDRGDLVRLMDSDLDLPYPGLWSFILTFGWIGARWRRRLGLPADLQPGAMHCSESIARRLYRAGYKHDRPLEPAEVSPGELALFTCLHRMGELTP